MKKTLAEAGVAHAGAGMDLEEASSLAIINLPSGQVGMISICSSSKGNFIFQTNYIKLLPSDYYERHGYPYDYTAEQVIEEHSKRTERGLNEDVNNFRTVIPFFEMNGDKLTKLVLKPIELGFGKSNPLYGLPYPAGRQASKELFDYLDNLNKEYGTVMKMKNGLFEVEI